VQQVQVGEADAQLAELRNRLGNLARDEMEAARARTQAQLALVPHAAAG
jgi:hypothetical protein